MLSLFSCFSTFPWGQGEFIAPLSPPAAEEEEEGGGGQGGGEGDEPEAPRAGLCGGEGGGCGGLGLLHPGGGGFLSRGGDLSQALAGGGVLVGVPGRLPEIVRESKRLYSGHRVYRG